jgi:hypothetical protein
LCEKKQFEKMQLSKMQREIRENNWNNKLTEESSERKINASYNCGKKIEKRKTQGCSKNFQMLEHKKVARWNF